MQIIELSILAETAILLTAILIAKDYITQKHRRFERGGYRKLSPEDHRLIYQAALDDSRYCKGQQWNVTYYCLLLYGAIVGLPLIPVFAEHRQLLSSILRLPALAVFVIGARSIVGYSWKQRELRIGIYKHLYRTEGRWTNLMRESVYHYSRAKYVERRNRDHSYRLDGYALVFIATILAGAGVALAVLTLQADP